MIFKIQTNQWEVVFFKLTTGFRFRSGVLEHEFSWNYVKYWDFGLFEIRYFY